MIFKLAIRSLLSEKLVTLSLTAALCAVVAPLLLLFSLRYGILTSLENSLKSNPVNLEIKMMSGYRLPLSFFDDLKSNPHVAFVLPLTRSLSATSSVNYKGKMVLSVDTLPTASGDPVAVHSGLSGELEMQEAYLNETLADDLNIKTGDKFKLVVSRIRDGATQNAVIEMTLKGIIKKEYQSLKTVMVNTDTLIYMEDYKDGFDPPLFSDGTNLNSKRTTFAKARLYVKSLEDLPPVSKMLRANYMISDKLDKIEEINSIRRVLNFVFYAVAFVSVAGGAVAASGLIFNNLKRLEKSFAMLLLTGLSRFELEAVFLLQNTLTASLAYLLSLLLFAAGYGVFTFGLDGLFESSVVVIHLSLIHIMTGFALTLLVITFISLVLSYVRLKNLSIAACLRQSL
ncbi:MAG: hypothetical protein ACI4M9_00595 [Succinivibrio sp.]